MFPRPTPLVLCLLGLLLPGCEQTAARPTDSVSPPAVSTSSVLAQPARAQPLLGDSRPRLPAPALEETRWEQEPELSDPSWGHAMATLGKSVVLFGSGTWEWNGSRWTRRVPAHEPPQRREHAMATLGAKIVLFGGMGDGKRDDTWEWDGANWTERSPVTRPTARHGHAMATLGDRVVLFGGTDSTVQGDTWEWDGGEWTLRSTNSGPGLREYHAMATVGDKVVLFGGRRGNTVLNDTWEWDGVTWTQRTPVTSPPARIWHGMTGSGSRALLGGGYSGSAYLDDTWVWDGSNWTRSAPAAGPSARGWHALAALGEDVVLYGGTQTGGTVALRDTWIWSEGQWREIPATSPPARSQHALATLEHPAGPRIVLFGGTALGDAQRLGDTWEWDGARWNRREPAHSPPPRSNHAMASHGQKVLLFGGGDGSKLLDDTWEWDGTDWLHREPATRPPTRHAHALAPLAGKVLLFGGYGAWALANDTWEWDGDTWTERTPASSPPVRSGHAMAPLGDKVVLFGGYGPHYLQDTWEWDGTAWKKLYPAFVPLFRSGHAMAALPTKVVLFGGEQIGPREDTFEWDGTNWAYRALATPPPKRTEHAMATLGTRIVLFGGHGSTDLGDTWTYASGRVLGGACAAGPECLSGHCEDGVCCDKGCGGSDPTDCQACSVGAGAPLDGRCAPLPREATCRPGSPCDPAELCDGIDFACPADRKAPTTDPCRAASCQDGVATFESFCDGVGACPEARIETCAPYLCAGAACGSCERNADCVPGYRCAAPACIPLLGLGADCAESLECASGHCADGVCCDLACSGQCEACHLAGRVGTCSPVSGSPAGSRAACAGAGPCQGSCDGTLRALCAFPGPETECSVGSCAEGIGDPASTCDGAGSCIDAAPRSCGAYRCGAAGCLTSCASDADCASSFRCSQNLCVWVRPAEGESGCGCASATSPASMLLAFLGLSLTRRRRLHPRP